MTQPDIYVAVDWALGRTSEPYCADGRRWVPGNCDDCSSLIVKALRQAGVIVPPDVTNTVGLYNWGKAMNGLVSPERGAAVRGAIMIKGRWYGYGPLGHASFSLGDGNEMAAHGRRTGVHPNRMDVSQYQDALIIPDVDYHLGPPAPTEAELKAIKALLDWRNHVTITPLRMGDRSREVATLNLLLQRKGLVVRNTGTGYGTVTRDGVHHLKVAKQLSNVEGKVFGGEAANALLGIGG